MNNLRNLIILFFIVLFANTACGKSDTSLVTVNDNQNDTTKEVDVIQDENLDENVYVHISGEVRYPGVYELPKGSRLFEVVDKAGGFTDDAATNYANLAQIVDDGQQYEIISKEQEQRLAMEMNEADASSHYDSEGRLNINLATKEELMLLSGIGESRAEDIIRYREESGAFADIEDIKNISGIKDALFSKIKDSIIVK